MAAPFLRGFFGQFKEPCGNSCSCFGRNFDGLGFRVWGLGFRVSGLGFRAWRRVYGRLLPRFVVTSSKDGPDSVFEKELPDADVASWLPT